MTIALYISFMLGVLIALYSYLIYPLVLMMRQKRRELPVEFSRPGKWPTVSIIIPAYNAEQIIEEKISSTLSLDYEDGLVDILVVSDGSTDSTDSIVESFADARVRLIRTGSRVGKEAAQELAIENCAGDILVFTDSGTQTPRESLRRLIATFRDDNIGAVSSEDRFIDAAGAPKGEGAYVRYEMWLRKLESERATLVGLSGSYFAARRDICQRWNVRVPSDFNVAIECVRNGKIAVSVADAHGIYKDVANPSGEYKRKVRTIVRGMLGLSQNRSALNPFKSGYFAFQLWSHKVMRWAMPWGLIVVLISTAMLAKDNSWFFYLFCLQIAVFGVSVIAAVLPVLQRVVFVRLLNYIVMVNISIVHASILALLGRHMITWEPTARQSS